MAKADLNGISGGYEVWGIKPESGKRHVLYIVYRVPGTGTVINMGWRVVGDEEWARLSGGTDRRGKVDRYITVRQARRSGFVFSGVSTEIKNLGKHPFEGALQDYKKAARLRPWMLHREMLTLWAQAWIEGREVRESDLKQTNWWRKSTPEQKAWYELVNADPQAAQRRKEDNRLRVQRAMEQLGMLGAPSTLINMFADNFTVGKISEVELQNRLQFAADPYIEGSSPLAGVTRSDLPSSYVPVKHKGKMFLRTPEGDYELVGAGTQARFGGPENAKTVNKVKKVGANKELANYLNDTGYGVIIPGQEDVKQTVQEVIGPYLARGWKISNYGHWASEIRRDPSARDRLVEKLQRVADANFSNYTPGTTYEDIAPAYRQLFRTMWGQDPDETNPFFYQMVELNDATEAQRQLRQKGLEDGNIVQKNELEKGVLAASNEGIRPAV